MTYALPTVEINVLPCGSLQLELGVGAESGLMLVTVPVQVEWASRPTLHEMPRVDGVNLDWAGLSIRYSDPSVRELIEAAEVRPYALVKRWRDAGVLASDDELIRQWEAADGQWSAWMARNACEPW